MCVIFLLFPVELLLIYLMYFVQRQYICLFLLSSCRITYTVYTVFCTKTFMSYSTGFLSNYVHSTYCSLYKGSIYHILLSLCRIMYTIRTVFLKSQYVYIRIYMYIYHTLNFSRITYTVRTVHTILCPKAVYIIFFWVPVELRKLYILYFVQRQYIYTYIYIILSSCRITYILHIVVLQRPYISYSSGFLSNY